MFLLNFFLTSTVAYIPAPKKWLSLQNENLSRNKLDQIELETDIFFKDFFKGSIAIEKYGHNLRAVYAQIEEDMEDGAESSRLAKL